MGEGERNCIDSWTPFLRMTLAASSSIRWTGRTKTSLMFAEKSLKHPHIARSATWVLSRRVRSPLDPREGSHAWHLRRRALIKSKHGGQLKLTDNDDSLRFWATTLTIGSSSSLAQAKSAADKGQSQRACMARNRRPLQRYFGQLTSHSRLNLTEGPPNYLTHAFPRNLAGRLLHDCGVYAVRSAYTLLSVFDRINRSHPRFAGAVSARWVRLPLHVGVMIESSNFGLSLQHNEHLFPIDNDDLRGVRTEWLNRRGRTIGDVDPSDPDAATLKFHEDLAASAFSSDLDMPISSTPLLGRAEPVTTQTIWNSYQKKVVPSQLFTDIVGAPQRTAISVRHPIPGALGEEREWYNENVLRFWNDGV